MKEAYIKAIKVINSCKTSLHITVAYNYVWNFSKLFANENGAKVLSNKLHERCNRRRKILGENK
jgi:hypothetical protein